MNSCSICQLCSMSTGHWILKRGLLKVSVFVCIVNSFCPWHHSNYVKYRSNENNHRAESPFVCYVKRSRWSVLGHVWKAIRRFKSTVFILPGLINNMRPLTQHLWKIYYALLLPDRISSWFTSSTSTTTESLWLFRVLFAPSSEALLAWAVSSDWCTNLSSNSL